MMRCKGKKKGAIFFIYDLDVSSLREMHIGSCVSRRFIDITRSLNENVEVYLDLRLISVLHL